MKIWEILQKPSHLAIYRATNTVESWNGVMVQVEAEGHHPCVRFVSVPKEIQSKGIELGRSIPLVGAVIQADWQFVEIKSLDLSIPIRFTCFARDLVRLLSAERRRYSVKLMTELLLELEDTISDVLIEMEGIRNEWLIANEDYSRVSALHQLKTLYFSTEKLGVIIKQDDMKKTAEQAEIVIALLYILFKEQLGIGYWNDNINCHLTHEEMADFANEALHVMEQ